MTMTPVGRWEGRVRRVADISDEVRLPSGRFFYAHLGLIGINDHLAVCEGFDGDIEGLRSTEHDDDSGQTWTQEERAELADRMIALWQRFKEHRVEKKLDAMP